MTASDVDRLAEAVAARLSAGRDDRSLLTPKQVADRLGVSERTARELIGDGGTTAEIASIKVRGARRVEAAAVDAFIAARRGER